MSGHSESNKHDHPLNIYVSKELKQALEELARRHDRTLATVVRSLLRIGIPLLEGIWQGEERMLNDPSGLFSTGLSRHEED